MDSNIVKFKYGTPVTESAPPLDPGSLVFDAETLALYLDTDTKRVQIKDPLKLSITGGIVTGDITVLDSFGTTSSNIVSEQGIIRSRYIETTGEISLDIVPSLYAVIDDSGRIRTRTRAQMMADLDIAQASQLGALAYKSSVSGSYMRIGTITAPTVTIQYNTVEVVSEVHDGELPKLVINKPEQLSLDPGTTLTTTSTNAMSEIVSVVVSTPTFTEVETPITLE